jgi:polar amino acid transport system permease protein
MIELFELFGRYAGDLWAGTVLTAQITLAGLLLGFVIGLPAALLRIYGGRWLRWLAVIYIELFRGTPVLVQLFIVYFGLPDLGITLSRLSAAYIAMGLNSGAYQAEYFRGAIQAIGSGQMTAARAIGMSRGKAIRYIILPQALRLVIPAWSNEPVALMKTSAVAFLIAVPDLMGEGKIIAARTFDPITSYIAVAIIYIALVALLMLALQALERRLRIPGADVEVQRV